MEATRKSLLGVPLDILQPAEFISRIEDHLRARGIKTVFAVNPEKIMRAQKDPELLAALLESDFLIPDGIGTIIGVRLLYGNRISRTTGIALLEKLLEMAARRGDKVFLFGARPEVNLEATRKILERFPSLNLVGAQHGYLPEQESASLVQKVNSSGADILIVGLGSPKQEKWLHRYRRSLAVKICLGVGGSLDVIAGKIPRAPAMIQRLGLEWFYRLIKEPSRFKRQMVLPRFAMGIIKTKLRGEEKHLAR
jgi:N-acetylglucosaminyldiphosphoundecaprenol N-acetyl-beta-D-mannosaminyltransferase